MTQSPTQLPKGKPVVQSGPDTSRRGRTITAGVLLAGLAVIAAACGGSSQTTPTAAPSTTATSDATNTSSTVASTTAVPTCPGNVAQGSPGVTAHNVNVAAVATLSGPLAGDFDAMEPGVKAYFDYIDSQGGVNGRTITLADTLDDQGNPSDFNTLVHTAVEQDDAFALVGVASPFFAPGYLEQTCIPTYGYNVTGNWSGPPNLYSTGGSSLYYPEIPYYVAYLMKQIKVHSFATLAYNVAASSDACSAVNTGLSKAGLKQGYTDLSVPYGGNVAPDVQQIKSSGAQLVISCMDVTDNISLARSIQQYGVKTKQYWLNGSDQVTLDHYSSLMQGVYFGIQHVPLTAPTQYYPGLQTYLTAMKKYAPTYMGDEIAIQGWASAALFVQGMKNAGNDLTQANVVKQDNLLSSWTADGLYFPIDWATSHAEQTTFCQALIQVQGNKYNSVFGQGHQVFSCFDINKSNPTPTNPTPATPPAGTPGT
jgi:ABC-type branched-subunit amino acid transport system substrate-binding protein